MLKLTTKNEMHDEISFNHTFAVVTVLYAKLSFKNPQICPVVSF